MRAVLLACAAVIFAATQAFTQGTPEGLPVPARLSSLQREVVTRMRVSQPRPTGELVVWRDAATGPVPVVQLLESNVADSLQPAIRMLVDRFLASTDQPVRLSMRLDRTTPEPPGILEALLAGSRAEGVRAPELANRDHIATLLREAGKRGPSGFRGQAEISALVDAEGEVLAVNLRTLTGEAEVDSFLHAIAYQMRFRPALVNDRGHAVWVSLPLIFRS